MAKAIEQKGALTVGHAGLGVRAGAAGSVRQEVHDGDTVNVRAIGNFGVRLLGVDAPEISFQLPGERSFIGLSHPSWESYLVDPFAAHLPPFNPPLEQSLLDYLRPRCRPGAAANHYHHAAAAENAFEQLVLSDLTTMSADDETFRFFLVFAHEVTDRYGRLLCFINRDQPRDNVPEPRPKSYNERLLYQGMVCPYFI